MTIVNTNKATHGQSLNLPEAGVTAIGADGTVELPEHIAQLLVERGGGEWKNPNAKAAPVEEEEIDENEEDLDIEDSDNATPKEGDQLTDEQKAEQLEALLDSVDAMTIEELVELATASKIKGFEKFKNKPEVLRTFIKNKLKQA